MNETVFTALQEAQIGHAVVQLSPTDALSLR